LEKSYHRHRRLLRARRKRPRRRTTEQCDELAPSHELPSDEANKLPPNQPQGGIINRPRSPDIRVANGFGWGGWGFNNPWQNNRNYYQRPQRWW